ncbi:MAG: carbohydrate ABC transporter permease, partial [Glycomyces artemisiae]|nr:carbohydrate ABC transporter permease [Glycomyces artemisiae]
MKAGKIGLYGLLTTAALTALLPLAWILSGSLQTLPELLSNERFLPADPQWGNYVTAWVDGDLGVYLRNSVLYTGTAVLG